MLIDDRYVLNPAGIQWLLLAESSRSGWLDLLSLNVRYW
jgi:hypothetical protein